MSDELPLACTLTPEQLRARRGDLLPGLADLAERKERIGDGVRLHFPSSPALPTTIARVIEAERRCCKFFAFKLTFDANDGAVVLTVTAPPDAQALLDELVAPSDR